MNKRTILHPLLLAIGLAPLAISADEPPVADRAGGPQAEDTATVANARPMKAEDAAAASESRQRQAEEATTASEVQRRQAEETAAIAEARQGLDEAMQAMHEAQAQLEEAWQGGSTGREALRDELSRAHRALRDASREIARAHRDLALADRERFERVRMINLGDRAVIGVLLGEEDPHGVPLVGVSPGGPAEKAGLRPGDVLVSIGGVDLAARPDGRRREAISEVLQDVEDGEEITVSVIREGERRDFTVTAEEREPASWQSLLRLPAPAAPAAPGAVTPPGTPAAPDAPASPAPYIVIDRIDIPEIDYELLERQVEDIREQMERFEHRFVDEDGEAIEFARQFHFDAEGLSAFGEHALSQADVWFGLPYTRGLELVALNPGLGRYFEAETGVLVVRAAEDNVYGLESGDVIERAAGTDVESPADLLRALRDVEPGSAVELTIKRDGRERTLKATMPERRLGFEGWRMLGPGALPEATR